MVAERTRLSRPTTTRTSVPLYRCPDRRCAADSAPEHHTALAVPEVVHDVVSTPGHPLDRMTTGFMQSRLGHDFSRVRIHNDSSAAGSARAVGAHAYTVGRHVVLGPSFSGLRPVQQAYVAAHELVHTQQTAAGVADGSSAATAERQAERVARGILSGSAMSEAAVPGPALGLTPDDQPVPAAAAGSPSGGGPEPTSMAERLLLWEAAGLLDPPFRPDDVDPIPPMAITAKQAALLKPVLAGAAPALGLGVAAAETVTTAVRAAPTLTLIEGGAGTAAEVGLGRGILAVAGRVAGPLAIIGSLLWSSDTQPAWADARNPITDTFFQSLEEAQWIARLKPAQIEYFKWLEAARRIAPPSVDEDPDPREIPVPRPEPKPQRRRQQPECIERDAPRRGGHARHDAFATKVSGSPNDHFVASWTGLSIQYDGRTAPVLVWEVKVGYEWLYTTSPRWRSFRELKLAELDAQKNLGMAIAASCGLVHLWAVPNKWVALLLNKRWGFVPPVLVYPE